MYLGAPSGGQTWYDLTWVEWSGIVGLLLTLLGLFLTWKQARGAKSAAEAASKASSQTHAQLRANQLLVQIGQLRWMTSALDEAIANNEHSVVRVLLNSWRYSAGQIHGILQTDGSAPKAMLDKVQLSLGMAFTASSAAMNRSRSVKSSCATARAAIGEAYDALNQWSGQNSYVLTLSDGGE